MLANRQYFLVSLLRGRLSRHVSNDVRRPICTRYLQVKFDGKISRAFSNASSNQYAVSKPKDKVQFSPSLSRMVEASKRGDTATLLSAFSEIEQTTNTYERELAYEKCIDIMQSTGQWNELNTFVTHCIKNDYFVSPRIFSRTVEYLSSSPDPLLALSVLEKGYEKFTGEGSVVPSAESIKLIAKGLTATNFLKELLQLFDLLYRERYCPPKEVYHSILIAAKRQKNHEVAYNIIEIADAVLGRDVTLLMYDLALETCSAAGQKRECLTILNQMKRNGYRRHGPTVNLYLSMNDIDGALATIEDAVHMRINPGTDIYESVSKWLFRNNRPEEVDKLLMNMIIKGKNAILYAWSLAMKIYISNGHRLKAEGLVYEMVRHGIEPWVMNFKVLLNLLGVHSKNRDEVNEAVLKLNAQNSLRTLPLLLSAIAVLSESRSWDTARIIYLDNMKHILPSLTVPAPIVWPDSLIAHPSDSDTPTSGMGGTGMGGTGPSPLKRDPTHRINIIRDVPSDATKSLLFRLMGEMLVLIKRTGNRSESRSDHACLSLLNQHFDTDSVYLAIYHGKLIRAQMYYRNMDGVGDRVYRNMDGDSVRHDIATSTPSTSTSTPSPHHSDERNAAAREVFKTISYPSQILDDFRPPVVGPKFPTTSQYNMALAVLNNLQRPDLVDKLWKKMDKYSVPANVKSFQTYTSSLMNRSEDSLLCYASDLATRVLKGEYHRPVSSSYSTLEERAANFAVLTAFDTALNVASSVCVEVVDGLVAWEAQHASTGRASGKKEPTAVLSPITPPASPSSPRQDGFQVMQSTLAHSLILTKAMAYMDITLDNEVLNPLIVASHMSTNYAQNILNDPQLVSLNLSRHVDLSILALRSNRSLCYKTCQALLNKLFKLAEDKECSDGDGIDAVALILDIWTTDPARVAVHIITADQFYPMLALLYKNKQYDQVRYLFETMLNLRTFLGMYGARHSKAWSCYIDAGGGQGGKVGDVTVWRHAVFYNSFMYMPVVLSALRGMVDKGDDDGIWTIVNLAFPVSGRWVTGNAELASTSQAQNDIVAMLEELEQREWSEDRSRRVKEILAVLKA